MILVLPRLYVIKSKVNISINTFRSYDLHFYSSHEDTGFATPESRKDVKKIKKRLSYMFDVFLVYSM